MDTKNSTIHNWSTNVKNALYELIGGILLAVAPASLLAGLLWMAIPRSHKLTDTINEWHEAYPGALILVISCAPFLAMLCLNFAQYQLPAMIRRIIGWLDGTTAGTPFGLPNLDSVNDEVNTLFKGAHHRLTHQVGALARRGTLNLLVGCGFSVCSLVILALTMLYNGLDANSAKSTGAVLLYLGPRLGLAIFSQIFGFYFLANYRVTLGEAKYVHNEITSLEMLWAAWVEGVHGTGPELRSSMAHALSRFDRNQPSKAGAPGETSPLKNAEGTVELPDIAKALRVFLISR
jgi:hypothetical protein